MIIRVIIATKEVFQTQENNGAVQLGRGSLGSLFTLMQYGFDFLKHQLEPPVYMMGTNINM